MSSYKRVPLKKVIEAKRMYLEGLSISTVAYALEIHYKQAENIRRGKTYKHITVERRK